MLVACLDVGSTFTKALLVDASGAVLGSVEHPTTSGTDVLEGVDAVLARLQAQTGHAPDEVRCSSSAGGGLRLAVIGKERAVSAQAGYRVGLSAGARVVHVGAGLADSEGLDQLAASRPDIVLLVGGTDGGDEETLRHNARLLAAMGPRVPYVVAGNLVARDEVVTELLDSGREAVPADNVIPRIGVLAPGSARAVIRSLFMTHVIGGKGLSSGDRFASLVQGATPDVVLRAVELLADGLAGTAGIGDVLVVDVGGATTDVYSVVSADDAADAPGLADVAGVWHAARTVEGDLGMRWSAPGVVEAAALEKVPSPGLGAAALTAAAEVRHDDVSFVPASGAAGDLDRQLDTWFGAAAVTVAARRHARPADLPDGTRTPARDLRRVRLIVGSGGVLRHCSPDDRDRILEPLSRDLEGGWLLPAAGTRSVVDSRSVLGAAGLLAPDHPATAWALLAGDLLT